MTEHVRSIVRECLEEADVSWAACDSHEVDAQAEREQRADRQAWGERTSEVCNDTRDPAQSTDRTPVELKALRGYGAMGSHLKHLFSGRIRQAARRDQNGPGEPVGQGCGFRQIAPPPPPPNEKAKAPQLNPDPPSLTQIRTA